MVAGNCIRLLFRLRNGILIGRWNDGLHHAPGFHFVRYDHCCDSGVTMANEIVYFIQILAAIASICLGLWIWRSLNENN